MCSSQLTYRHATGNIYRLQDFFLALLRIELHVVLFVVRVLFTN